MNKFLLILQYSLKSLLLNKARTILTLVGVIIGITTVTIVVSIGETAKEYIVDQVSSFGSNNIFVEIQVPSDGISSGNSIVEGVSITSLTVKDAESSLSIPNIKDYYAAITGMEKVGYKSKTARYMIQGLSPSYINIDTSTINTGRFFNNNENNSFEKVIVIGSAVKEQLFPLEDPIGKLITLKNYKFKVIGVLDPIGVRTFINYDEMVLIPINTAQKLIYNIKHIPFFAVQVEDESKIESTSLDLHHHISVRHKTYRNGKHDFKVSTVGEALDTLGNITLAIQILLFMLGLISLIVGGVGIMNIMLATISERRKEIGIRKALGASKKIIQLQFLIESITICLIGGIIGTILGIIITYIISIVMTYLNYDWSFIISLKGITVSFSMAILEGIVFGWRPAIKASELEPIEAMRS